MSIVLCKTWTSREAFLAGNSDGAAYELRISSYNPDSQSSNLASTSAITETEADCMELHYSDGSDWCDVEDVAGCYSTLRLSAEAEEGFLESHRD